MFFHSDIIGSVDTGCIVIVDCGMSKLSDSRLPATVEPLARLRVAMVIFQPSLVALISASHELNRIPGKCLRERAVGVEPAPHSKMRAYVGPSTIK